MLVINLKNNTLVLKSEALSIINQKSTDQEMEIFTSNGTGISIKITDKIEYNSLVDALINIFTEKCQNVSVELNSGSFVVHAHTPLASFSL